MSKQKTDIQHLYCGVQGSGKTYKMKEDTKEFLRKNSSKKKLSFLDSDYIEYETPSLLVYDPFCEWIETPGSRAVIINGLPVIKFTPEKFEDQTYPYMATNDKDEFLEYAVKSKNSLLVVEEMLQFDREDFKVFRRISSERRHSFNALYASTQRPAHLPIIMISSSTQIFCFTLISKDDTKKLTDYANYPLKTKDFSGLEVGECVQLIQNRS
tara:strand:- start:785 stop:1420 length:636 start_codon:yes stop_codon:yes gene_type:complete